MTLLAIVAIHTAANEPPKVRQVMNKIHRNVAGHGMRRADRVGHLGLRDRGDLVHDLGHARRGCATLVERFDTEFNPDS